MKKVKLLLVTLIIIFCLPSQVLAGDFDGSKPLLCAIIEIYDCGAEGECEKATPEEVDAPRFFKIDFEQKRISGTLETGQKRTTQIIGMERVDGKLILQGVDQGTGWSAVIREANGKVTLSGTGDQVVFAVFGACIAQ
ncbi:MAG: hypothetical protein PVH02_18305 [Desulfobacteraceae bacterium]|jgi:hypothetical protein